MKKRNTRLLLSMLIVTACDGGSKSTPTPTPQAPQPYPVFTEAVPPGGYPAQEVFPTPTLPEGYVAPSP